MNIRLVCLLSLFPRPTMGSNALNLQSMCLAKLQGKSSLCVHCMCVGYHSVVCIELNVELEGTSNLPLCSKDENQYSSENDPQLSAKERLGHPCTVFFQRAQLPKYQVKSLCFVCFSFFFLTKTTQPWLLRYGSLLCYRILSCCIFYAIPFLMTPGGKGVLSSIPLIALLWWRRGIPALGVPLFSPQLPHPVFLQSPWFVNCLHLFCQPTCTKCKKEFLNR